MLHRIAKHVKPYPKNGQGARHRAAGTPRMGFRGYLNARSL